MRITDSYLADVTIQNLNRQEQQLTSTQQEASTGQVLGSSSDNPALYAQSLGLQDATWQQSRYTETASLVQSSLGTYNTALTSLSQIAQQAQQLAEEGANSSTSGADTATLAGQAQDLLNQAMTLANQQQNGQYLFGGTVATSPPYSADSGTVTYSGDNREQEVAIAPGIDISQSVSGQEVFGSQPGDSTQLLGALQELVKNLSGGQQAALSASLDNWSGIQQNLSGLQGEVGVRLQQVQAMSAYSQQVTQTLTTASSNLTGANMASVAVNLSEQQTAYQAALSVASQLNKYSLISQMQT